MSVQALSRLWRLQIAVVPGFHEEARFRRLPRRGLS